MLIVHSLCCDSAELLPREMSFLRKTRAAEKPCVHRSFILDLIKTNWHLACVVWRFTCWISSWMILFLADWGWSRATHLPPEVEQSVQTFEGTFPEQWLPSCWAATRRILRSNCLFAAVQEWAGRSRDPWLVRSRRHHLWRVGRQLWTFKYSDGRAMLYASCVSESAQQLSQRPDLWMKQMADTTIKTTRCICILCVVFSGDTVQHLSHCLPYPLISRNGNMLLHR